MAVLSTISWRLISAHCLFHHVNEWSRGIFVKLLKMPSSSAAFPDASSRFNLHPSFKIVLKMSSTSYAVNYVIDAILDVTDHRLSQYRAAQKHGVPPATLSDRLRALQSKSEATQPAQLLSKSQETRLVTWILRQEYLGYGPSHSQIRATVAAFLRQQDQEVTIGVHWISRFMKRHLAIKRKDRKVPGGIEIHRISLYLRFRCVRLLLDGIVCGVRE
jgi:hypothetical protein